MSIFSAHNIIIIMFALFHDNSTTIIIDSTIHKINLCGNRTAYLLKKGNFIKE